MEISGDFLSNASDRHDYSKGETVHLYLRQLQTPENWMKSTTSKILGII